MKIKIYNIILVIVIVVLIVSFLIIKNNRNVKLVLNNNDSPQNNEDISSNEINDNEEISNIDEDELSKLSDNILINDNNRINTKDIYALVCKHVETGNYDNFDNTLVAISKKDNSEIPLIKFTKNYTGAFDFNDNKLYFYDFSENSFHGFYMIDFSKNAMLQQIFSVEEKLGYLDDIQFYDGKLYYTADEGLYSLDISSKEVKRITDIYNFEFHINKETGMLYYTEFYDKALYEMDLRTNDKSFIANDAAARYISKDKLIYETNSEYIEYDFSSKTTKKITNSWGGSIGQTEIVRYDGYYLYIDNTSQLIKKTDDGKEEKLRKFNYISSILILSNDKLLIQEEDDYGIIQGNYIYDLKTNEINETDNSFKYYYEKITKNTSY